MRKENKYFISLEKVYWDWMRKLDLFQYLIPINISEEKSKFLSKLFKRKVYNPSFSYERILFDIDNTIKVLEKMKKDFSKLDHPLVHYYEKDINENIQVIINISNRSAKSFPEWLSGIYGFPNKNDYEFALDIVKNLGDSNAHANIYDITSNFLKSRIESCLKDSNIIGWKILLKNSSARIFVSSITKTITIKKEALFNSHEIQRLLVHEIGVHVLRYENGSKQKFILFSKGFPGYLETEEGLAIFSEKRNGLLSNIALTKYCCRLIASYLSRYQGFYDIFKEIVLYLDPNDAFDIVMRIKRGLLDTNQIGGFTKDQIYLTGLRKLEMQNNNTVRKLFFGKLGLSDLSIIDTLAINHAIEYPRWLERK